MASLFEQYGIKEVADVTLYDIDTGAPVLFLDSLKVSTIEQTAEQAEARGGKGNSPLIIWDYGKEITITLEDALYSPASMAIMFGDKNGASSVTEITKMTKENLSSRLTSFGEGEVYYKVDESGGGLVKVTNASEVPTNQVVYKETTYKSIKGHKIEVSAETFPGTYRLVGDTLARNRNTGKDEYFQFIIPRAKMSSENSITLESEGDPSVFNMTMRVLRPETGHMMELIQYGDPADAASFLSAYSRKTGGLA